MPERPLILVIEDEYFLQADLETVLIEAGLPLTLSRLAKRH
jgi:hypothetical protein